MPKPKRSKTKLINSKRKQMQKKKTITLLFILLLIIGLFGLYQRYTVELRSPVLISPIPEKYLSPIPEIEPEQPKEEIEEEIREIKTSESAKIIEGIASYYSRAGCLGCYWRDGHSGYNLYMHNGDVLKDEDLTVALIPEMFFEFKNKNITIVNLKNGKAIEAKVADSGGFGESYSRVADLSVATKEAIGCSDLCDVRLIIE